MSEEKNFLDSIFKSLGLQTPQNMDQPGASVEFIAEGLKKDPGSKSKVKKFLDMIKGKTVSAAEDAPFIGKFAPVTQEDTMAHALYIVLKKITENPRYKGYIKERDVAPVETQESVEESVRKYKELLYSIGKPDTKKLAMEVLDYIANNLESKGRVREAYTIDKISDKIESLYHK